MRFVLECVMCGNVAVSPPGRDVAKYEEFCELVDSMDLRCVRCDGACAARLRDDG